MSRRLLFLLGGLTLLAVLLYPQPAQARGEQYKFLNKQTIVGSSGVYRGECRFTLSTESSGPRAGGYYSEPCALKVKTTTGGSERGFAIVNLKYDESTKTGSTELIPAFLGYGSGGNGQVDVDQNIQVVSLNGSHNRDPSATASEGEAEETVDCDQGVMTWFMCPFLDKIQETIANVLSDAIEPLLRVSPLSSTSPDGGKSSLFAAWEGIRNLANVLFVLVFLVIIFANTLSLNISAYTVKKMLPRLVIAAVLVQFSFLISALVVDLGNVLGGGVVSLIESVGTSTEPYDFGNLIENLALWLTAGVAAGAVVVVAWPLALPLLLALLISVLAFFLTIGLRFLLIGVLVVISPLAFVAWVLPNTEDYFKFWYKNFIKLIMMYPLITLILAVAGRVDELLPPAGDVANNGVGGISLDVIRVLVFIAAFAIIPKTFQWAGSLMAMGSKAIDNYRTRGLKKLGDSEMKQEAKRKAAGNVRNLAAGQGVSFGRAGAKSGLLKKRTLMGGKIGTGIGRAATLDPQGHRALSGFNKSMAAGGKALEDAGLDKDYNANNLLQMNDADFDKALNPEAQPDWAGMSTEERAAAMRTKSMAQQVRRFRGQKAVQAAAAVNLAEMGGNIDEIRKNTLARFGDNTIGEAVWGKAKSKAREGRPDVLFTSLNGETDYGRYAGFVAGQNRGKLAGFKTEAWQTLFAQRDASGGVMRDADGKPMMLEHSNPAHRPAINQVVARMGGASDEIIEAGGPEMEAAIVRGTANLSGAMYGPGVTVDAKSQATIRRATGIEREEGPGDGGGDSGGGTTGGGDRGGGGGGRDSGGGGDSGGGDGGGRDSGGGSSGGGGDSGPDSGPAPTPTPSPGATSPQARNLLYDDGGTLRPVRPSGNQTVEQAAADLENQGYTIHGRSGVGASGPTDRGSASRSRIAKSGEIIKADDEANSGYYYIDDRGKQHSIPESRAQLLIDAGRGDRVIRPKNKGINS